MVEGAGTGQGAGPLGVSRAQGLILALRPHQWAKNLLVFVPLVLTPALLGSEAAWIAACLAFAAFSLCASAGYLVNDCADLEADRAHPTKRDRPIARGAVSRSAALATAGVAGLCGLAVAALVSATVLGLVAAYLAATLVYSIWLKRLLLVDVIALAGLYTVRVLTGAAAVVVVPTPWLLAFSLFIFTSLALVKRYGELALVAERGSEAAPGRAYRAGDRDLVAMLGTSSAFLSVLVLCLYINSTDVRHVYGNVTVLWVLCPLLLYWVGRIWFLARRGELSGDPVAFAIRDPASLATGLLAAGVLFAATLL